MRAPFKRQNIKNKLCLDQHDSGTNLMKDQICVLLWNTRACVKMCIQQDKEPSKNHHIVCSNKVLFHDPELAISKNYNALLYLILFGF